jgi:superfamily I DNA/RNA helicase
VDSRKVRTLAKSLVPWDKTYIDILCDAVGYAKGAGFGIPSVGPYEHDTEAGNKLWSDMLDFHDLWDEVPTTITPERVIEDCAKIYQQSIIAAKYDGKIDFNDMILLPLLPEFAQGKSYGQYDWVMVDEAQDTSDTRRLLALAVLKNGGRFVAVGDPSQSIYLFAGASLGAMDKIKCATGAIELPLNITYRCPQSVVKMANQWVPDFIAHESAPEGIIRNIRHDKFWMEKLTSRDVILCRNTRPLVGIAGRLRDNGMQCVVEGQSGKALIGLATKWGDIEIRDLLMNLEAYREKEYAKWLDKGKEDKAEWVNEKVGILSDIARGLPEDDSINKLVEKIEYTFGEGQYQGKDILRLCTIHRSKGREWDRVYLIGRNRYMPSKWATKEHEIQQETNLSYVAVTRTKEELVEVRVPIPDPKRPSTQGDWWEL